MSRPTVTFFYIRPFRDNKRVVGIRFSYNAETVEALKRRLREARGKGEIIAGGWLQRERIWYCEEYKKRAVAGLFLYELTQYDIRTEGELDLTDLIGA